MARPRALRGPVARHLHRPIVWVPVSFALLGIVVWRSRLWEPGALPPVDEPLAPVLALVLAACVPLLWGVRSALLLRAVRRPVPIRALVPLTAFTVTLNSLTPGSAGELFRIWLLRSVHGVAYASGTAVVAVERLGAFLYLAGSAILAWGAAIWGWPIPLVLVLLVALVAAPGVAYARGARPGAWLGLLPVGRLAGRARWGEASEWLQTMDAEIARILTSAATLARFALLSLTILATYVLQLVFAARALGVDLDLSLAWALLAVAMTIGRLSQLPFGLGALDLALVTLLTGVGIDDPRAAAIALAYRLVSGIPLSLAGVASYAWLSARSRVPLQVRGLGGDGAGTASGDDVTGPAGDVGGHGEAGHPK